ncbi:MAG: AraC family transcriptional regulator, partial [Bacteroidales bacterium]|nr:AraC family transcriptional regulator [Bacteroidales bacterium]
VFTIAVIKNGEGNIIINNSEYMIFDNSLAVILPNHILKTDENKYKQISGYIIILSMDFLLNIQIKTEYIIPIFLKFYNTPVISITDRERDIISKYLDLLCIEKDENSNRFSSLIYSGITTSLIYVLSEIFDSKIEYKINEYKSKSSVKIFKEFLLLAIKEFKTHREITYYAKELCITPKYLSTIIKEISNNKASKWIEMLVITESKNLLQYSDMTIQEIGYSLNFANPSFFGAYFKKYTGNTPGEYRNRHKFKI